MCCCQKTKTKYSNICKVQKKTHFPFLVPQEHGIYFHPFFVWQIERSSEWSKASQQTETLSSFSIQILGIWDPGEAPHSVYIDIQSKYHWLMSWWLWCSLRRTVNLIFLFSDLPSLSPSSSQSGSQLQELFIWSVQQTSTNNKYFIDSLILWKWEIIKFHSLKSQKIFPKDSHEKLIWKDASRWFYYLRIENIFQWNLSYWYLLFMVSGLISIRWYDGPAVTSYINLIYQKN